MDVKFLQKELKNETQILACAKEFNVVGDPTKLKICYLLCKHPELNVNQMAQAIEASVSNISHALEKLRQIKAVKARRQSREVYYSLSSKRLASLIGTYLGGYYGKV